MLILFPISFRPFLGLLLLMSLSTSPVVQAFDRGTPHPAQTRSVVIARQGIVATSHPLAAQVGLDVLKSGGNAADGAIAANAVLGVVEPMSCGIGGDLFVIYWDAKTQKLYGLNASGRSPFHLNRQVFAEKGLLQIPTTGPLSWSVPGCVDGWRELHGRFCRKPLAEILAPAITAAEEGEPVPEVIAGYWKGAEAALRKWPDSAATFLILIATGTLYWSLSEHFNEEQDEVLADKMRVVTALVAER